MKASVGKAIPKDRATPSAGRESSAPRQQAPKKRQRTLRSASRINNRRTPIRNVIQAKPRKLSVNPIQLEPRGKQDAAISPRTRLIADSLNSGERAFGTRKCHSQ